jgi:dTDP-4-amino-4,6-dideoxygalactose transaminase
MIPFLDFQAQYNSIKVEINEAIQRVLNRQFFILGPETDAFEQELAEYLEAKHVVTVNSGTDALIMSLRILGIGKGDEVITPVNSFIATTLAITEVGATPIFVDIDPDTYEIDVNQIANKITKKTKAILPVHLYGLMSNIESIVKIAKEYNLFVVEDACQAIGSTYKGKKAGTWGDIGTFSFYPGKNLGAYGDGGAMCTNDKELYEKMKMIRNYGQTQKYHHKTLGYNSRLDEIQAAILRVKLKNIDIWNQQRNEVVSQYKKLLKNIKTQKIPENYNSNYHIFLIEIDKRDELQKLLDKKGVQTLIHYPIPIHLQECNKYLGYRKGDFPVAEKTAMKILSLPIYPEVNNTDIKHTAKLINNFL